jgi:transposase
MSLSTIGLDLAKNVFQVHGISDEGAVVIRRRFRRSNVVPSFSGLPPYLVGMEDYAELRRISRPFATYVLTGRAERLLPAAAALP